MTGQIHDTFIHKRKAYELSALEHPCPLEQGQFYKAFGNDRFRGGQDDPAR